MDKKVVRSNKLYPLFSAFSGDLIFFIIIDTLFFTFVKDLSISEIVLLTTVSTLFSILLQIPILSVMKKIGNTYSCRFGTFILLCGSIMITFCDTYYGLMIGMIFYSIAFIFKNMENILLKNNLIYLKKEEDYMKIMGKSNTLYSVFTAIIAFIVGFLFALNPYLPMILNIMLCGICFILSLYIFDVTEYKKVKINLRRKKDKRLKLDTNLLVIFIFIAFSLICGLIVNNQTNSKLLIQYQLADLYKAGIVASVLGIIVSFSRIGRIISNIIFNKIYPKIKDKSSYIYSIILLIAFMLIIFGYFININFYIQIILMSVGFITALATFDPLRIYFQDLLLKYTDHNKQKEIFNYLYMARQISTMLISFVATLTLLKFPLIVVIILFALFAVVNLIIVLRIYRMVKHT